MKKILVLMFVIIFVYVYIQYDYNKEIISNGYSYDIDNYVNSDNYLDVLYSWASSDSKVAAIMDSKDSYPDILLMMLARNSDMLDYDSGYTKYKGEVFSDNIGKVDKGVYPLLLQYDKRWGYGIYGDDVIAVNGCGPTAVSMVVAGLTGRNDITPYIVSLDAYNNGYYQDGTSWSFFTEGIKKYGIVGREIALSYDLMIDELEQNHPIICSMGPGDFTMTGHIIVITGVKNGKFVVNDSNSKDRSKKLWSYEEISDQIKNLWSFSTF